MFGYGMFSAIIPEYESEIETETEIIFKYFQTSEFSIKNID